MSKVFRRTMRKDSVSFLNHVHSLPDGHPTQGQLLKPSQSSESGWHTHIYQHEGLVHETGPAFGGPTHSHESIIGTTSGPQNIAPKPIPSGRTDHAIRIGSTWVVRNESGIVVSKGKTKEEAESRYKTVEA